VLGPDRVSDFAALHSGRHNEQAQLYAFDMLAGDGEDKRPLALSLRKTNRARLLRGRIPGIFTAEYKQGEIGQDLFRVACRMGLEASSRSAAIAPTPPANASTGSRRRTPRIRPIAGSGTSS
jgi:ATP-dependent DNA ligase